MKLKTRVAAGALLLLTGGLTLASRAQAPAAGEWPQWRGPDRTGVSQETGLAKSWPGEGPALLWKSDGRGEGYGTVSVTGDRIYGMGNRGEEEVVWALDAGSGKELWSTPVAPARSVPRGDGPRSTPTVDGERLYVLGVNGDLACLDLEGKVLWRQSLVREFGGQVPRWGYSESPLVDGEKVIATPGGREAALVAFNRQTGEVVWRSRVPGGDTAHYSSAIVAEVDGQRQYVQFLSGGVVGVAAADGKFLWRYDAPANRTANCSTPIFRDNHVFAASGYNTGGGLAKLTPGPDGVAAEQVYFTRQMRNHHGGMVLVGDYLYGFDESNLTCLEFNTGNVRWFNRSVGKGSVVYADGFLYVRSERGPVALLEATPAGYVEKGRFDQPERSTLPSWPYPVVAGGRLYLRDQDLLLCYDVRDGDLP
jgi:outer membrane protein assembly factor BamB